MNWYVKALKNYAVLQGRARRKEYWYFWLIHIVVLFAGAFVLAVVQTLTGDSINMVRPFAQAYLLATFLPAFTVGVRRLHDTD